MDPDNTSTALRLDHELCTTGTGGTLCCANDSSSTYPFIASQPIHTDIADKIPLSSHAEDCCPKGFEEQIREDRQNEAPPSLYIRLRSFFYHKDINTALLTPPPSPQISHLRKLSVSPSPPPSLPEHLQLLKTCGSQFQDDSENPLAALYRCTPLTPDSICHQDACGDNEPNTAIGPGLEHNSLECTTSRLETTPHLELNPHLSPSADGLNRTDLRDKRHPDGVHLLEAASWSGISRSKSVLWGKTRAPPIPWDVLIDDISSPPGSYGSPSTNCDNGYEAHLYYDLQYALELSRRDRRKIMDSDPDSAGEYSKSRESWAILHLDRVVPTDQEYWFRFWLQWHCRLEERLAFKLHKAQKKEEHTRYQLIDPWPVTDRHTARHPRRADEDLHPNLRLIRHRTRSAPGRINRAT